MPYSATRLLQRFLTAATGSDQEDDNMNFRLIIRAPPSIVEVPVQELPWVAWGLLFLPVAMGGAIGLMLWKRSKKKSDKLRKAAETGKKVAEDGEKKDEEKTDEDKKDEDNKDEVDIKEEKDETKEPEKKKKKVKKVT